MNKAPLIIAGVAVLAVAAYLVTTTNIEQFCADNPHDKSCIEYRKNKPLRDSSEALDSVREPSGLNKVEEMVRGAVKACEDANRSVKELVLPNGVKVVCF